MNDDEMTDWMPAPYTEVTVSYGPKGPWNVHGTRGDTVVKWYSVDEGPLAEVICHGDVDPAWVADALNAAESPQAAICDPGQETR